MKQVFSKIITKFALFVQKRQKYFRTRAICALQKGSFPHCAHIHAPRKNFALSKIVRGKIRWGVRYAPEKSKWELSRPGKLQGGVKCALPRKRAPAIWLTRSGTPAAACRPGDPGDPRRPSPGLRAAHRRSGDPGTAPGTGTAGRAADLDKPRTKSAPAGRLDPAQLRRPKTRTVILHKWYK